MSSFSTNFLIKLPIEDKKYREVDGKAERGAGRLMVEVSPNGLKQFFFVHFIDGKRKLLSISKLLCSKKPCTRMWQNLKHAKILAEVIL